MKRNDNQRQPQRGGGFKRPRPESPLDLQSKASQAGGALGYSLEQSVADTNRGDTANVSSGVYGRRVAAAGSSTTVTSGTVRRHLSFSTTSGATTPHTRGSGRSRFSRNTTTTTATRPAVHVVCAISENMARETCVASLDAGSPTTMQVTKQGNGQTYAETLAYLDVLQPDEVLLNEGRKSSQLARKIMELYHQPTGVSEHTGEWQDEEGEEWNRQNQECQTKTVVKFVSRGCFDQTRGAEVLRRVARPETYDASVIEEYILLSSAHAVVVYTQQSLGANFVNGSVFLSVNSGGNNRMAIDRSTLLQLELLVNSKSGKTKHSLIGTIDKTKTVVGGRLLRTNLMMPPTQVDTINARLDLVDLFLNSEDFFYSALEHLSRLPDVDKMLSNVALIPKTKPHNKEEDDGVNVRMAAKGIAALVGIKSALSAMPALASVLEEQLMSSSPTEEAASPHEGMREEGTVRTERTSLLIGLGGGGQSTSLEKLEENHLLRAIACTLRQPELYEILQAVTGIFTPSTEFSRNANAMRHQECFALKAEEGGIMALLRKNYLANVDDIYKKADEYAELYGFHVGVKYTTLRGHFLAIPAGASRDLPSVFIQPTKAGRYIHCSTEEITSLNTRSKDNVRDLLLLTYSSIQEVLDMARERYDALAALCDAIALLDMCHSFADTISMSSQSWCRPIVVDPDVPAENQQNGITTELAASLIIRKGRFGIEVPASGTVSTDEFIANDTYAAKETSFTLITGINGSGKSTYLKQLAIIVVLAHCGCFVPAEQASIPLRDRLCARIGNADDQENNISTFMLEMKETAFICNNAGPKSLVLIDELGRATSNEDGVALAWSVAEYLLKKKAVTFFVTHFSKLNELAQMYPYAQNVHLESSLSTETREIKYTHRIQPGACRVPTDYGVSLADACGWPAIVVERARVLEGQVRMQLKTDNSNAHMVEAKQTRAEATKVLESAMKSLMGFMEVENAGSFNLLRQKLGALREQAAPSANEELLQVIKSVLSPTSTKPMDDARNRDADDTSSISSSSSEGSSIDSSSFDSE